MAPAPLPLPRPNVVVRPQPAPVKGHTLILTDDIVRNLRYNIGIAKAFSFVRTAMPSAANCPPCQRRHGRSDQNIVVLNTIKAAIAGLPNDKKAEFKRLLGVTAVELYIRESNGVRKVAF